MNPKHYNNENFKKEKDKFEEMLYNSLIAILSHGGTEMKKIKVGILGLWHRRKRYP